MQKADHKTFIDLKSLIRVGLESGTQYANLKISPYYFGYLDKEWVFFAETKTTEYPSTGSILWI